MMTTLKIDPSHSGVHFTVKHMMFAKVRGSFQNPTGTIEFDEQNPANSSVSVEIPTDTVSTNDAKRDGHLKTADFFDAEKNPTLTFKSTQVSGNAENLNVTGDLSMNGVTKPVTLKATFEGKGPSPMGSEVYAFSATTKLNRKDWGMEWNAALETGGMLVSDDVTIDLDIEANPA